MTADNQARVMIALSYFLLSFVCLAHSRSYYYGQSNGGNQGKPLEKLYFYRTLSAFDFKMSMELRNPKQTNKQKTSYFATGQGKKELRHSERICESE